MGFTQTKFAVAKNARVTYEIPRRTWPERALGGGAYLVNVASAVETGGHGDDGWLHGWWWLGSA